MSTWGGKKRYLFEVSATIESRHEDQQWSNRELHVRICGFEVVVTPHRLRRNGVRFIRHGQGADLFTPLVDIDFNHGDLPYFWRSIRHGD